MKIEVIINAAEEGGYWAQATHIPGCITEGDTIEELMTNLCEAIDGCMEVLPDDARTRVEQKLKEDAFEISQRKAVVFLAAKKGIGMVSH